MKKMILCLLSLLCISIASAGCSGTQVVSAPYADESLVNYKAGKRYLAEGRFELAKECFTLALASSRDPGMRYVIMQEIDSVNMMIETRR